VLGSLEKLNQETREILLWRYVDGLDIGEIAEITEKTKNAVYVAIHRGLKELKRLVKNNYEL
jgi:DNA-directed RNA polymerase specialized sigma24 family protein